MLRHPTTRRRSKQRTPTQHKTSQTATTNTDAGPLASPQLMQWPSQPNHIRPPSSEDHEQSTRTMIDNDCRLTARRRSSKQRTPTQHKTSQTATTNTDAGSLASPHPMQWPSQPNHIRPPSSEDHELEVSPPSHICNSCGQLTASTAA